MLAYFAIVGIGFDRAVQIRHQGSVTLTEEQIKDIDEVSRVLKEAGVIDQPFIFRLFCKFTGAAAVLCRRMKPLVGGHGLQGDYKRAQDQNP